MNVDDEEDLKAGSIIELPFWLASSLASRRYVLMELPRIFQPKNRNAIAADPTVVDFSEKCTYFYEIGMKMAALSHDESIADILRRCLNIRYQEIVKRTANRKQTDQNDFLAKLASLEKQCKSTHVQRQLSNIMQTHTDRQINEMHTNSGRTTNLFKLDLPTSWIR